MSKPDEIVSPQKKYTQAEVDVILQVLEDTKNELKALRNVLSNTFVEAERQRTRWSKILVPELVDLNLMKWVKNEYGLPQPAIVNDEERREL